MKQTVFFFKIILILIFSITFFDKVMHYGTFKHQLFLSPLIPPGYIPVFGIVTMLLEGITIGLLLSNHLSNWGFLLSAFLLSLFGCYLWCLVVFFSFTKPCGCGFIFNFLNYRQHIVINFLLSGVSAIGYYCSTGVKK